MHRWLSHVLCVCISFSGHMFTYNYIMVCVNRWLYHALCVKLVILSLCVQMVISCPVFIDCYIMLYVYMWSSSDTLCEQISGPMYIDFCLFVLSVKMVISFQCVQMVISCHMHIDGYLMPYAYSWLSHPCV